MRETTFNYLLIGHQTSSKKKFCTKIQKIHFSTLTEILSACFLERFFLLPIQQHIQWDSSFSKSWQPFQQQFLLWWGWYDPLNVVSVTKWPFPQLTNILLTRFHTRRSFYSKRCLLLCEAMLLDVRSIDCSIAQCYKNNPWKIWQIS